MTLKTLMQNSSREPQTWVLMTGMPITQGHEDLILFASEFSETITHVVIVTKDGEPYAHERVEAVRRICAQASQFNMFSVIHHNLHNTHSEDPESSGFWRYWSNAFKSLGFRKGDFIVGSEPYIGKLADELDGVPIPYDFGRDLRTISGTMVRDNPVGLFDKMSSSMRNQLKKTFVMFGAESVGKTTTARAAATAFGGIHTSEFARPYLDQKSRHSDTINLTAQDMEIIWNGQSALQSRLHKRDDVPFIWLDTDLLSTYGYYKLHPELLTENRSDLLSYASITGHEYHYFVLSSNIPFEEDKQRLGGDRRESDDQFWIDILNEAGVSYTYIESGDLNERLEIIGEYANFNALTEYKREFN